MSLWIGMLMYDRLAAPPGMLQCKSVFGFVPQDRQLFNGMETYIDTLIIGLTCTGQIQV